jgi:hypothetical protein
MASSILFTRVKSKQEKEGKIEEKLKYYSLRKKVSAVRVSL